jgi:hypothetical protein
MFNLRKLRSSISSWLVPYLLSISHLHMVHCVRSPVPRRYGTSAPRSCTTRGTCSRLTRTEARYRSARRCSGRTSCTADVRCRGSRDSAGPNGTTQQRQRTSRSLLVGKRSIRWMKDARNELRNDTLYKQYKTLQKKSQVSILIVHVCWQQTLANEIYYCIKHAPDAGLVTTHWL